MGAIAPAVHGPRAVLQGRRLGLCLLFAVLLLVGFTSASAQDGGIRGTVVEEGFDTPLEGVRISVAGSPATQTTDRDGSFLIEGLAAGKYTLIMAKPGFERAVMTDVVVLPGQLANASATLGLEILDMAPLIVVGQALLGNTELGLLSIRQESTNLQDAISSELISKAGVGDAAGALKLVVGASVVDGKYATVRGLSDRYTGTTLNGVRVPSSDPRRRAAQIDVFPTATIENVTVTKTFSPDLQGDFTGGGVDIQTKSVPDAFTVSFSSSVGNDSLATENSRFVTYVGGGTSASGRALPAVLDRRLGVTFPNPGAPTADGSNLELNSILDEQSNALPPVLGIARRAPGKNNGYSLTLGHKLDFGREGRIGIIAARSEKDSAEFFSDAVNNQVDVNQSVFVPTFRGDSRGRLNRLTGTLGTVVVQPNVNHEVALRYILNESIQDEARFQLSSDSIDLSANLEENQALRFSERTVESLQLAGDHKIPIGQGLGTFKAFEIDFTVAQNSTEQDEPDQRLFRNQINEINAGDIYLKFSSRPANVGGPADVIRRIFRNVVEDSDIASLNVGIPFEQWSGLEGKIKFGGYLEEADRNFRQDSFSYNPADNFLGLSQRNTASQANQDRSIRFRNANTDIFDDVFPNPPASAPGLWTDEFLDPAFVGLAGNRCSMDDPDGIDPTVNLDCAAVDQLLWTIAPIGAFLDVDYSGQQEIEAAYLMAELPVSERLSFTFGARQETTLMATVPDSRSLVQIIVTQPDGSRIFENVSESDPRAGGGIDDDALLPSISAVYEIVPGTMKLRGSWNRTIARPTFRELAPVATIEFLDGDEFTGNPELTLSDIENSDLRWEWFPSAGRVLAFSVFNKEITDPIELISFTVGGRDLVQPVNYPSGRVEGWEFESRSDLGLFSDLLSDFTVGLNFTSLDSEVDVPQFEQESLGDFGIGQETRRLQGQPEYLFNANVTYDNKRSGTTVSLFYNVIGETLLTGAARGQEGARPNVFNLSFKRFDINFRQRFKQHFSFSLKLKNVTREQRLSVFRTPESADVPFVGWTQTSDGAQFLRTQRPTAREFSLGVGFSW